MTKKKIKERIKIIKEGDWYCATMVNYPLTFQAKSAKEVKKKGRVMLEVWRDLINDVLDQDNPFELKRVTKKEWHKR